jgi:hypothetical protein
MSGPGEIGTSSSAWRLRREMLGDLVLRDDEGTKESSGRAERSTIGAVGGLSDDGACLRCSGGHGLTEHLFSV